VILSYVLSFIYIGIYWNNHHHLFQATEQVRAEFSGQTCICLFWLSLFPFTTGWMGENGLATIPSAVYGFDLLMAAIAYLILERVIIAKEGRDSLVGGLLVRIGRANSPPCFISPLFHLRLSVHGSPPHYTCSLRSSG
jgi:hypothetical protein